MCIRETPYCPDCDPQEVMAPGFDPGAEKTDQSPARRDFMKMMGGGAAAMIALNAMGSPATAAAKPNPTGLSRRASS